AVTGTGDPERGRGMGEREVVAVAGAERGGALDEHVVEGGRTGRAGGEDRDGERAGAGPGVDDDERVGPTELLPPRVERTGEHRTEQGPDLGRGEEIAPTA